MKTIPILFSTPMVQGIQEDRKTMTRRIIKPQPDSRGLRNGRGLLYEDWHGAIVKAKCQTGDVLWVRETWIWEGDTKYTDISPIGDFYYKADFEKNEGPAKWKPSIFMPKEAARIFLKVTDVRIERVQDICEGDAAKEGVLTDSCNEFRFNYITNKFSIRYSSAVTSFMTLWIKINGKDSWVYNPWVWGVSFEKTESPWN